MTRGEKLAVEALGAVVLFTLARSALASVAHASAHAQADQDAHNRELYKRHPGSPHVYQPSWHDALTKLGIPDWLNPL